ncbi:IDEAL domain-containing protein [Ammoniphilus sp. CFH 90114]|uniref:IDEAL domain-containing protein n=1 Tax=Ammoniphilus sp. CFH 90114 TaxID=2493665 RepID=UPI0013E96598|nr:IDEAL domain-containing protein [Ammoniphilus sp. CFH 90114]
MREHHLNDFKKIKYICEIYKERRFYYRQEYLVGSDRWGEPKQISEETFLKRKRDGFPVEYRHIDKLPPYILSQLQGLDSLIDLALDTKDEEWFRELVDRRNMIF